MIFIGGTPISLNIAISWCSVMPDVPILPASLSVPAISINNISVAEGTPGPVSISGSLNPGLEENLYRINGAAGQQLHFQNVSATSRR